MITAEEARELGTYESRLASVLDSIDELIRQRAPSSRKQTLTIMFDIAGPSNKQLVDDVLKTLKEAHFKATAHEVYIEINNGNAEVPRMEFDISWSES